MIKTILLAIDLGIYTPLLLQHAASLSKENDANLVVVHAIEPLGTLGHALLHTYLRPEVTAQLTTTGMDSIVRQIRSSVIDSLTDDYMDGQFGLLALKEVVVLPGSPVDVILQTAEDTQADLLVLGSRTVDNQGSGLGSVSQKILSISKWPVYIVPHSPPHWHQNEPPQISLW